jgi:nitroreductase
MNFLELAQVRYSCRQFRNQEVEPDKIEAILKAAKLAPTACNYQPFKIWVMKSEPAKNALKEVTNYTFGAPVFFVVGVSKEQAWTRKFDQATFAHVDGAIVGTHMMLEIAQLGLGTTWVGSFDAPRLQTMFPQMKEYDLIAIFPTGYPADNAKPAGTHTLSKEDEELIEVL